MRHGTISFSPDNMKSKIALLLDVLNEAEKHDYSGYSKFDALNSPLLKSLAFNNKWLRLIYTQIVKESPFNIRPVLGVKKSRNPKGIALFARAYFSLYQNTSDPAYIKKGESLIQWLLENHSPNHEHLCWGYNFIWQNTLFLQDIFEPNAVVSIFVGEALIHAYHVTNKDQYLIAARSIANFIIEDLPILYESNNELAIAYVTKDVKTIVLNNQVLAGAFLIKVWRHDKKDHLLDIAVRLMNFTVNKRTDYYAWYYTYPKGKSLITHDNYHTGGILDGLIEYFEETGDDRFLEVYWKALEYYRLNLFEENGAPKWRNNKQYPHDVHGAAQGILSFKRASKHNPVYLSQAEKIADWTIENLYRRDSFDFTYRKGRWIKWNYSLMRWCNAWMTRALAELLSPT